MSLFTLKKTGLALLLAVTSLASSHLSAGGIALGGTRIIYPQDAKQTNVSIQNTSDKSTFLVQSWVEDAQGKKSKDFIATPPLFVSGPKNENTLRLMYTGKLLPKDRESLYYFNAKAVPSADKKALEGKSVLMLAAITRVKLFVRPDGLTPTADAAPAELSFHKQSDKLSINNPTPYYITVTELKVGSHKLSDVMVAPKDKAMVPLSSGVSGPVTFRTINDYGAVTPEIKAVMK